MFVFDHRKIQKKLENIVKKAIARQLPDIVKLFIIEERNQIKEEYNNEIAQTINSFYINSTIDSELYSALNYIDHESIICMIYRSEQAYNSGDYEKFLDSVKRNSEILSNKNIYNEFLKAINTLKSGEKLLYLSIIKKIDYEIFEDFFKNCFDYNKFEEILGNLGEADIDKIEKIISLCYDITEDTKCLYLLADIYMKRNLNDKLQNFINNELLPRDIILKNRIEKYFYHLGNYKKVIEFSDPDDNYDTMLADALCKSEDYEKALEIYRNVYYNRNKNVINKIIEIEYTIGDYYSVIKNINSLEKNGDIPEKFEFYRIDSELRLDLYDDASKHIKLYKIHNGENIKIMETEIRYYRAIGEDDKLYELIMYMIKNKLNDKKYYDDVVEYLFNSENYSEVIKFVESENIINDFKTYYFASLIYTKKESNAMNFIKENPAILNSGYVIDALFLYARNDERIKELEKFEKDSTMLKLVLSYIKGEPAENINYINAGNSAACQYIMSGLAQGSNDSAGKYKHFRTRYGIFNSINYIIQKIENKEIEEIDSDSSYFTYPLTRALIRSGQYKLAWNILELSDHEEPDPFYLYFRALIEFHEENYAEAKKDSETAISFLKNAEFILLRIKTEIILKSDPAEYLEMAVQNKYFDIFDSLEIFLEENKIMPDKSLIDYINSLKINSIPINRTNMYYCDNYKCRLKYSAKIIKDTEKSVDGNTHYSILYEHNRQAAMQFMEKFRYKDSKSYFLLANYYMSINNNYKALINFNMAFIRDKNVINNISMRNLIYNEINYNELVQKLLEIGDYFNLTLLYYYRKEFTNIVNIGFTNLENLKTFEFLTAEVWENTIIKNYLILSFEKSGNVTQGELLASRLENDGKYSDEAIILNKIIEEHPEELNILDRLLKCLLSDEEPEKAMDLIYRKFYDNKTEGLFMRLVKIYYNMKDYSSVLNVFENNPNLISYNNIKFYIFAELKFFNYNRVRHIIKEYSEYINEAIKEKIDEKISISYRMQQVLKSCETVLNGLLSGKDETEIYNSIPGYLSGDVKEFLNSDEPYSYIDPYRYNEISKNILSRLYNAGIKNIEDIKLQDVYSVTSNIINARNFYIFINRSLEDEYKLRYREDLNYNDIDYKGQSIMDIVIQYNVGLLDALNIISLKNIDS